LSGTLHQHNPKRGMETLIFHLTDYKQVNGRRRVRYDGMEGSVTWIGLLLSTKTHPAIAVTNFQAMKRCDNVTAFFYAFQRY
jgi:hypothetical protein